MDEFDDLRRELDRHTGPARVGHLHELARVLTDRYWRTGPSRSGSLPDLTEAIGALTEAYGYFAPDDRLRATVAAHLGTLLAVRHIGHHGPGRDRVTGIALLTEALTHPRLPFGQSVLARLMLGQLHMRAAIGDLRTGSMLPALLPGGGRRVESARAAAGCFRAILAGPELSPQVTSVTQTMLTLAEGFVEAFRGTGLNLAAVGRIMAGLQQSQRQWRELGLGSLFTAGSRLARTDPLDRPVILIESDDVVAPPATPKPSAEPAPGSAETRRELQKQLNNFAYGGAGPDVGLADEIVALATTVLHGDDATPADHLPLALGLTLRAHADPGPGADDDLADARVSLRTAAAASAELPADAIPLFRWLVEMLGEPTDER
ncbi:hypothetical protein [Actinoplanes sp. HUAS TT8]|uniref:hypothetical protein n=1 Tax=Actinoplanes sp. HUAS TT8 TaxID=3447453 RepID=UPI003F51F089